LRQPVGIAAVTAIATFAWMQAAGAAIAVAVIDPVEGAGVAG
jgi:hypothetical protein